MRPLIVYSSSKAIQTNSRRVLHFYMLPEIWLKLFLFNSLFDFLSRSTQDSDITHFKTNTINFFIINLTY